MNSSKIEDIVKWRMGTAYDSPILDWRDPRLNFDIESALSFANAGAITIEPRGLFLTTPPGRPHYDPLTREHLTELAEDIFNARRDLNQQLAVFAAMQDVRLFPSVEYLGPPTDGVCAQISFNRPVESFWRSRTEIILWPLPLSYRQWKLPLEEPAAWKTRRPNLLWRGQTTGISYVPGPHPRPIMRGVRVHRHWLLSFLIDEVAKDPDAFEVWGPTYQRLHAVSQCRKIRGADVRFVPMWNGDRRQMDTAAKYLGKKILSERMEPIAYRAAQQTYKFILTLPGNDVPSSLREDLLSGCAILMPRPFWECTWFYGLTAGVHYIPLSADLADLEERLQWCRDHDAECREIAANARAFALEHFKPEIEFEVQARIVERLARQRVPPPEA